MATGGTRKGLGLIFLSLLFLLSCGTSQEDHSSNISFDLPTALTKAAQAGDLEARFVGVTGSETPKSIPLTIAPDGKVSGRMMVKPGKWTFEVQFFQVPKSGGDPVPVAFFRFDERDVAGEVLNLTYEAKDLKFDDPPPGPVVIEPSISPPNGCQKKYDCDGDGFSNFEEIKAGSDPFDPNSRPVKPVTPTPTVTPVPPPPKPLVVSPPPPPPPAVMNRPPVFGGYLSSAVALVKDPKAGITFSWNQSDPDGDELTTTVSLYRGGSCTGGAVRTATVKGSGKIEASLKDLEPRMDSSYNLLITDPKGGKAVGDCQSFTTADTGLVGWWRFDDGLGSTTAKDSSGNEHHGTLKRYSKSPAVLGTDETSAALVTSGILPTWTKEGISGGALQFDGTGTVEVPDPITSNLRFGNGNFSTEVWFRIPKGQTILTCCETLIGKGRGGSGWIMELRGANYNGAWKFSEDADVDPDNGNLNTKRAVEITDEKDGTRLNDGNWHQMVGVRDGSKGYAFLDGRLILSGTSADLADMEAPYTGKEIKEIPVRFGFSTGTRALRGALDEVAVYNRALSAKEIRQSCSRISPTTCPSLEPTPVNPTGNGNFAPDAKGIFPNVEWTTASEATYTWSLYRLPTATSAKTAGKVVQENQPAPTSSINLNDMLDYRTSYLLEVKACDLKDPLNCVTRSWNFTTTHQGLVGWWRFDEGKDAMAKDSSGKGNDGTLVDDPTKDDGKGNTGPAWVDGTKGKALKFDGVDDYVDVSRKENFNFERTDSFSICAWINPTSMLNTYKTIASKMGKVDSLWAGYEFSISSSTEVDNPNALKFALSNTNGSNDMIVYTPNNSIATGWQHVCVAYTGTSNVSGVTFYINGAKQVKNVVRDGLSGNISNTNNLEFGRLNAVASPQWFIGNTDEIAIYNRALTTSEIRASCRRNDPTGSTCAADDVPEQVTPSSVLKLPPTRVFLSWNPGQKPTEKEIDHYRLCYTEGKEDIANQFICPNTPKTKLTVPDFIIVPLLKNSSYRWKVKTCYNAAETDCSAYSPVWEFKTHNFQLFAGGSNYCLALKGDGSVRSWGGNTYGQLGDGTTVDKTSPVSVTATTGFTSITAVSAGHYHSLTLKGDGTVWAWGFNPYGQLGDGTLIQKNTPIEVKTTGFASITAVETGGYHSLALKGDGTVWAWGHNLYGQLGDWTLIQKNTPFQVPGLTLVTAVAAGHYHSLALKGDGMVWAWGFNDSGQLGDGTIFNRKSPIEVSTELTSVIHVAAGGYHSLALKSDGTVWAWGRNDQGQLGDGTTTNRTTPVQVSGLTSVTAISAGSHHSLALKSDGTIWAWGSNVYGQLGNGLTTNKTTPVQVKDLTSVTAIETGEHHSLALKSDGTVWAWGNNSNGQIGDGSLTARTTPFKVW